MEAATTCRQATEVAVQFWFSSRRWCCCTVCDCRTACFDWFDLLFTGHLETATRLLFFLQFLLLSQLDYYTSKLLTHWPFLFPSFSVCQLSTPMVSAIEFVLFCRLGLRRLCHLSVCERCSHRWIRFIKRWVCWRVGARRERKVGLRCSLSCCCRFFLCLCSSNWPN